MPKNQPTAAQKARRLQAATGAVYTDLLKEVSAPANQTPPANSAEWLRSILQPLEQLGWPASPLDRDSGRYLAHCGPVVLDVSRDVEHVDSAEPDADPDDPRWADRPLYLGAMAPHEAYEDDFGSGARAGAEPPAAIAVRLDAELAAARWSRVKGVEPESTTSCPICGDRYPEQHLLANSPEAEPCCPACTWDQDQRYKADLPYLAVQIDRLFYFDLAVPAGWAAVAAVIALSCGANLGRRLERELRRRRGFPVVMPWWDQPMDSSWIWLPPKASRHPAFAGLGAGASLAAITAALERHDPALRSRARQLCREAEVRWRPSLWPAAVAYAVAFTTQSVERDRHRKPVHVVDSTGDGLSQIRAPFAVSGDALNVEGGLEELLEHLLFPLLLGHGLYDAIGDGPR